MGTDRPTWDEVRIAQAIAISTRSLCTRDKVGAVITNPMHQIVGEGYNGPPSGFNHENKPCTQWCARAASDGKNLSPSYADCPSLHAEANAIASSDRRSRAGGTIYVTSPVCITCAKLIANSDLLKLVVFDAKQNTRGTGHRETGYALLNKCGIEVVIV